jgi:hypothetical protein
MGACGWLIANGDQCGPRLLPWLAGSSLDHRLLRAVRLRGLGILFRPCRSEDTSGFLEQDLPAGMNLFGPAGSSPQPSVRLPAETVGGP